MKAHELFSIIKMKEIVGDIEDVRIEYLSRDSRDIQEHTVLFCIPGSYVDGHDYVKQAVEKGVALIVASKDVSKDAGAVPVIYVKDVVRVMALVANKFYDYPSSKMSMIGVTGTNGKTTVSYLIESIYKNLGKKTGLIGTIGLRYADVVYPTSNTTPDSLILQRVLREMVDAGVEMCVSEVSSHSLYQGRTRGVDFDTAVFTNLTHEHLETHKTMEEYGTVKSMLFAQMGNTLKCGQLRCGIINIDDPLQEQLLYRTSVDALTYSLKNNQADFYAENCVYTTEYTEFDVVTVNERVHFKVELVGEFNVANILAAVAACYSKGISLEESAAALSRFQGVPGRMQVIPNQLGIKAIVDYAHTPDGLEKLFIALKKLEYRRLIFMIGHDGGNRDETIRPLLGGLALDNSDYVVFTSVNPRDEDPIKIMEELVAGKPCTHYEFVVDRKEAIERVVDLAESGDLIVFSGKGHEPLQLMDGYAIPHDEAGFVLEALQKREKREQLK